MFVLDLGVTIAICDSAIAVGGSTPKLGNKCVMSLAREAFFPKESHTLVVNSPPIQNLYEYKQAEPGSVKIFSKKEPEFPTQDQSDEVKLRKLTHSQYIPGATLLIPYEVESLRCWALIDTSASRSLMSLELAKTFGNPIAPNPSRLTGPIANEMHTKGIVKAEVKIGTCVASDEFVVVEDLYPEIMIG